VLAGGALWLRLWAGYLPARATVAGRLFYFVQYSLLIALLLAGGAGDTALERWIPRALGGLQVLVLVQLLLLGRSLVRELRHAD